MGKLLIAENESIFQDAEMLLLESMGLEITHVNSGKDAVEHGLSGSFDIALINSSLPEMDTLDAITMMRQVGFETPIMILAGADCGPEERVALEQVGIDGFLEKPIELEVLQMWLDAYMQQISGEASQNAPATSDFMDDNLMQLFVDRTEKLLGELKVALDEENWKQVRVNAHTVKGSGTTFGFPELTRLGKEVCDDIDHGKLGPVPELTRQLIEEMEKVLPDAS